MKSIIKAKITMGDDRELNLHAKNMNELLEKIKSWNSWEDMESYFNEIGKNENYIKKEKNSGWYIINKI